MSGSVARAVRVCTVLRVPSWPRGTAYDYQGTYLVRFGASLVPMSKDRLDALQARLPGVLECCLAKVRAFLSWPVGETDSGRLLPLVHLVAVCIQVVVLEERAEGR